MYAEINSENLNDILNDLGKTYRKMGGKAFPAEITIVGGAAILAMYEFRESSMDVDAIIRAVGALKDAAGIVGDKYNLEYGWLNSDFENTDSFSAAIRQHSRHYRTFANVLDVRIIEPEYLLAMKARSGRKYKKDISDIVGVIIEERKRGRIFNYGDVDKAFREMYGGEDIPHSSAKVLSMAFGSKSVEEMEKLYKQVRREEREARRTLNAFEDKYPGVLNQKNVNEVLEAISNSTKKQEVERTRISDIQKKLDELKAQNKEDDKNEKSRSEYRRHKRDDTSR